MASSLNNTVKPVKHSVNDIDDKLLKFAEILVKEELQQQEDETEQCNPLVISSIKVEPELNVKTEPNDSEDEENNSNMGYSNVNTKTENPVIVEIFKVEPIIYHKEEPEDVKPGWQDGYKKVDGRHYCNYCPRSFARLISAKNHVINHQEDFKQKQCNICFKRFNSKKQRDMHMECHEKNSGFQCDRCQKLFLTKKQLTRHIVKNFCKASNEHTCPVCGKMFVYLSLYKSHLVKHETLKPHSCDICQMKFKHKSAVTRHMLLHNGVRNFACTLCDKKFFLQGLLKTHLKSHTKLRHFVCDICQKVFSYVHNLNRHRIVHSKPKKLTCDVCQKSFPKESRLKYHMQVHSREKKFSCDLCNRFFSHKQNVVRHFAARHTEMLNPAFVAGLKFVH